MIGQHTQPSQSSPINPGALVGKALKSPESRQDLPQDAQPFSAMMGELSQQSDIVVGQTPPVSDSVEVNQIQQDTQDMSMVMNQLSHNSSGAEGLNTVSEQNQPGLGVLGSEQTPESIGVGNTALVDTQNLSEADKGGAALVQGADVQTASAIPVASLGVEGQASVETTGAKGLSSPANIASVAHVSHSAGANKATPPTTLPGLMLASKPTTQALPGVPVSKQAGEGTKLDSASQSSLNALLNPGGATTTGGMAGAMGQSAGQNMGQNSGQNPEQSLMQKMFANLQQVKQVAEKQSATHFSDALMSAKKTEALNDKDLTGSLLGGSGLAFDRNSAMPLGLQSINVPVRHPKWGQALGQKVVMMANQKISEAKIMLNPEKLGPMQVKLQVDKDQVIHVSMLAQHGVTREAMENALPKLRDMLEQAGLACGSVDVGSQQQFDQQQAEDKKMAEQAHLNTGGHQGDLNTEESQNTTLLELKNDNIVDYYA